MSVELTANALWSELEAHTIAAPLLRAAAYPWEALATLADFIRALGKALSPEEYDCIGEDIWVAKTATVAPTASLTGPLIVCPEAELRHCAFIRGAAIVGVGAVVGNSTELKNCILFDGVQVPHYNYVGDSILGYRSHMGAGAVTSNVKSDKTSVTIRFGEERVSTGRRKLGALLGDFVEVGCGSVLNPGTVIGSHCSIYPLSSVRGYVPPESILKDGGKTVPKQATTNY